MITDLEKLSKLEQKVAKIEMDLRKKQTTEAKLMEFATDANKFVEVIEVQTKRIEYLNQRLQAYINRECVLTEVSRYVRGLGSADVIAHFHIQLMKAYAWDAAFWEQRGSGIYTIKEWFDKIMKLDDVTPVSEDTII
jgi:hypothetical protein